MKVLITGASSGIGRELAIMFSGLGYDLFVVARKRDALNDLRECLVTKVTLIDMDLSIKTNCYKLYEKLKAENIDIVVNNAGFGDAGDFIMTSLDKELEMIDVNIRAYHILMKLFIRDFVKRGYGRILNVASMAGFMPGPYMATYYATKSYIVNLSLAVYEELRKLNSDVKISVFCPGPVKSEFSKRAHVHFKISSITSKKAAEIAIEGMFKDKLVVFPGNMKVNYFLIKICPVKMMLFVNSLVQERTSE